MRDRTPGGTTARGRHGADDEHARLSATSTDLDKRIRATGAQVIAGVLDQEDAVAVNAPLREQRHLAKLQLGALPAKHDETGGVKITQGHGHHEPPGPPKGSSARYRVGVEAEGVGRPRVGGQPLR